ncbi:MAG: hypothetical protein ACM3S2_14155 [Ignavibacteriales bacterium]
MGLALSKNSGTCEILHYYYYKNITIKMMFSDGKYYVVLKKHYLHLFKSRKEFEFSDYNEAEDKYLELKSRLLFMSNFK